MQAREAACFVAQRMRNSTYVNEIAEIANHKSLFPSQRSPSNLASGDAGLALMYSYLDACVADQDFDGLTQQYLRIAAQVLGGLARLSLLLWWHRRSGVYARAGQPGRKTLSAHADPLTPGLVQANPHPPVATARRRCGRGPSVILI